MAPQISRLDFVRWAIAGSGGHSYGRGRPAGTERADLPFHARRAGGLGDLRAGRLRGRRARL